MIFKILYQNLYDYSVGISTIKAKDKSQAEEKFYNNDRIKLYDIINISKANGK